MAKALRKKAEKESGKSIQVTLPLGRITSGTFRFEGNKEADPIFLIYLKKGVATKAASVPVTGEMVFDRNSPNTARFLGEGDELLQSLYVKHTALEKVFGETPKKINVSLSVEGGSDEPTGLKIQVTA